MTTPDPPGVLPEDNISRSERPSAAEVDFQNRPRCDDHDRPKCGECGRRSDGYLAVHDSSVDHWQTVQLDWNEECDVLLREHLPNHQPGGSCPTCPVYPPKPVKPYER